MDDESAVESLAALGLTTYEARVFVALQTLGVGTASDVSRVSDVPRSQVYGAAEKLEERGFVEVQQSEPLKYRPVDLAEARDLLRSRYERRADEAFDALADVQATQRDADEHQEDVWTVQGGDAVTTRAQQLVEAADRRVFYGGGNATLTDGLADRLADAAADGLDVTVVSADPTVLDRFEGTAVTARSFRAAVSPEDARAGRIVVVDDERVLLSIRGTSGPSATDAETAIWSAETGFARVIVRLVDAWFEKHFTA